MLAFLWAGEATAGNRFLHEGFAVVGDIHVDEQASELQKQQYKQAEFHHSLADLPRVNLATARLSRVTEPEFVVQQRDKLTVLSSRHTPRIHSRFPPQVFWFEKAGYRKARICGWKDGNALYVFLQSHHQLITV